MTDPIKALADAAREVLAYAKRNSIGAGDWVETILANALAAYDAAQVPPRCARCGDTHRMDLDGETVLCTHCPVPCEKCRAGGTGAYCGNPQCDCACHKLGSIAAQASQPPIDAEIEAWEEGMHDAMLDLDPSWALRRDLKVPSVEVLHSKFRAQIAAAKRLMLRARPEPVPSDAEIDKWRDYAIRVAGLDLGNEYHRHVFDWGRSLMRRARPDAGLLRTEFGISSYPVPSKASDGWPDNFSVWRLKDGRTRIYRQAVAPTDAEVEGCNATELREALFNRNNDVERLVEQRDGLLRAAKAVLAVDVLMRNAQNGMPAHVFNGVLEVLQEEAIPDLRAEVARVDGK